MIFAIYYTRIGPAFIKKFTQYFPHVKEDVQERFPENVDEEILLCYQSIKRLHPEARCVFLTDLKTTVPVPKEIEVICYDVDPNQPAYMRLQAQMTFLETVQSPEPVIFCDYDILFQKSISPLFEQIFDLGLAYRKSLDGKPHPAPINGGLLVIHPNGLQKSLKFLKSIHTFYLKNFPNHKEWGGFQASLNKMIGQKNIHETYPDLLTLNATRILLLPAAQYNYAIGADTLLVDYKPDKTILHFKGAGKKNMIDYWNSYLS